MNQVLSYVRHCKEALALQVISGSLLIAYATFYCVFVVRKPRIVFKSDSTFAQFLLKNCSVLSKSYWPTFWCFGGRIQTVIGSILKTHPKVKFRRELVQIPDGGQLYLHWADSENMLSSHPTVLVMPGLTGTYQENYILQLVKKLRSFGHRVVVFNNRGLAGCKLKTPKAFCAACSEDLQFVISHLQMTHPRTPVIAIGYSLGGIILTNYLSKCGQENKEVGLIAAMTVSVPWDMFKSTESLEQPLNYFLFNRHLTKFLLGMFKKNIAIADLYENEMPYDIEHVLRSKTIREFDDRVIAPMFGFSNSSEYYAAATLHTKPLHLINIPLLCLSSGDDPFAPLDSIPINLIKKCSNILLVLTDYGGHTAFLEGIFPFGQSYMDRVACEFTQVMFQKCNS